MTTKKLLLCLCTFVLGIFATSCDDNADDPKYRSLPPMFSDMEVKMVDGGSMTLKAGQKILATAVQENPGRLLYKAKYNWSATPVNGAHSFRKEVIYDLENFNPTDTIVFENPGVYQLTFTGRYDISGQAEVVSKIIEIENGKITYGTPSSLFYDVKIEKRVTVK